VQPAEEFDGTQYFSSGLMGQLPPPFSDTFTLKFTAPGTFEYTCAVHAELGMKGTVTVVE
jgi:plastocyanin